jgi:hypothetical protein
MCLSSCAWCRVLSAQCDDGHCALFFVVLMYIYIYDVPHARLVLVLVLSIIKLGHLHLPLCSCLWWKSLVMDISAINDYIIYIVIAFNFF